MAHLNGYSVGARLGHKRLTEGEGFFFPDQRASPPASRIAKDFIVMNLIFVQTASPRPLDKPSRRCTERERVLRGVGEGWRTLECRAVSRPVTRNPIKLGDANEI